MTENAWNNLGQLSLFNITRPATVRSPAQANALTHSATAPLNASDNRSISL